MEKEEGKELISDPIYNYILITSPKYGQISEVTEKDIIDTVWVQRLRRIHQLQSAFWVYPCAEHTRFVHSLGTMHLCGEFVKGLYRSLCDVCSDTPPFEYVEEVARIAGLLHDIGHGPFSHFFDQNYLESINLNHERIGRRIIEEKLCDLIRGIRRSPTGYFDKGLSIDPHHIGYLIEKGCDDSCVPPWLFMLKYLFCGIYTGDNMDYILRDGLFTGVSKDPIDTKRLIHYSFFTEKGLTIHKNGISALLNFLQAKINLYLTVYYHRTVRAIDLELEELFPKTMSFIICGDIRKNLDLYLDVCEWNLFCKVRSWIFSDDPEKRELSKRWNNLLNRKVRYKMSAEVLVPLSYLNVEDLFERVSSLKRFIDESCEFLEFKLDAAIKDTRPINPIRMRGREINVFDPQKAEVRTESLSKYFELLPKMLVQFRIFSTDHKNDKLFSDLLRKGLKKILTGKGDTLWV